MENRELKEYLAEFADGTQVSVIIANPKKRKVYIPEEIFMIKDEKAPIFKTAHYCLVGDLYDVIPQLIQKIEEKKGA